MYKTLKNVFFLILSFSTPVSVSFLLYSLTHSLLFPPVLLFLSLSSLPRNLLLCLLQLLFLLLLLHLLLLLLLLLFIFLHLFFKIGGVWGSCVGAYQNFTEKWKDLLDEDFTDEFILANNNGPPWIYGTTGVRRLLVRSQQLYLWFYHLYIYLFCV